MVEEVLASKKRALLTNNTFPTITTRTVLKNLFANLNNVKTR